MKRSLRSVIVALACAPLLGVAQNVVFNDTFTNDALNPASYPAVTAAATGWVVLSNKAAPAPAETGGALTINMAGTSSGFVETQALFAAAPVQLLPGTYLELTATFTPAFVLTNSGDVLSFGLFNSNGSAPVTGLLNSGLTNSATTFASGGAKGWVGYNATIPLTGASPGMFTRPAQTGANNTVQDVVIGAQSGSVGYSTPAGASASGVGAFATTLVNGATYTLAYKLALSSDGAALTATVRLFNGTGTTGTGPNTLIGSYSGKFSGAALLTTAFDALAIGWRADAGTSNPSNLTFTGLSVGTTGGAPYFTTQPPAALSVMTGSSVTLAASVGGSVSSYQWQKSADGGSTFSAISGSANPSATTATLSITNAQASDAGVYRLVATNAGGTTNSSTTTLTVTNTAVAPTISASPAGSTILTGTSYTFNVTANGTAPLTYQWYFSADGTAFGAIAGATNASYTISSAAPSNEGSYRVSVANSAGSATSDSAVLKVNQPLAITTQPSGATLNPGDNLTLTVAASGRPAPTYQWYLNGTTVAGATNDSLAITNATGANTGLYTVVVRNSAGDSVTSQGASVAVVSTTLAATAMTPASGTSAVLPDTRLTLTFNQAIAVGVTGFIRIYDAASPATPVDTIDLATGTALMRTLQAASTISTQSLPVQTKSIGGATNFNYYPVTVSGSTATIYPRNNVLAYGKTYYVTVDPGAFLDSTGLAFAGITGKAWTFGTRVSGPANSATIFTVADDGTGDFCTVQAALDAIPAGNTTPRAIYVRKGTYFEQVYFAGKHSVALVGEDRGQSVIAYPNNNNFNNLGGTYHRMVLQADHVNNAVIANLTVRNTTPKGGSQAEGIVMNGTTTSRAILTNVDLLSYQDTLLINGSAYITGCHISGDVDFMWGNGPNFFNRCQITALSSGGYFTQIRNGSSGHGNVYLNCTLDGTTGVGGMYLARIDPGTSSFPYSEVVWLNCVMGSGAGASKTTPVSAVGWQLNNTPDQTAASAPNVHFWEYNSQYADGTAIDVASRIGASKQLTTATDADTINNYSNPSYVLGGWTPQLAPVVAAQPSAQVVKAGASVTLTAQAVGLPAPTYQWRRDGQAIPGATNATYTIASAGGADAGSYSVVITNDAGVVITNPASVMVGGGPPVITQAPASTSGLLGANTVLSVWAQSDSPLTYQWTKNGVAISGATGASLRLVGLQSGDAADYAVAVTSATGTTTSSAATLKIVSPATTLPTMPVIPSGRFLVTAYGAIGDGSTDNTKAIQAAISAATAAGGGTVEFPGATAPYLSGPITLASNINLQLDAGAVLKALPFGTYPNSRSVPAHFITIPSGASNIEFSGTGTVDGDGSPWWSAYKAGTISERPRLVQITKATNLLLTGVTFLNSPMFNLAFSGANNNVTVFGVTISAPGDSPNTDGMDLSGTNYLVQNCSVSVGDDNVVAKPGSTFCRNLYIAGCSFGTGHGVSVGGQTNVGLDGMTVTNCTFNGTSSCLRLKADPTQGGPVQNVTYSNLTMTNVTYPILFYSYYNQLGSPGATSGSSQITPAKVNTWNATPPNSLASTTIPTWQNITVSNVTATNASGYSTIWGLPLASGLVSGVTLENVSISGGAGLELYDAANVRLVGTNDLGPVITCNALAITSQPQNATVKPGDTATFAATVVGGSGSAPTTATLRWTLNGNVLTDGAQPDGSVVSGASTSTLTIANVRPTTVGAVALTATTQLDGYDVARSTLVNGSLPVSMTSAPATLAISTGPAAWLVNVSVRTTLVGGQDPLIVGVTTNDAKPILIRGVGPGLANYGVTGELADPSLQLYPLGSSTPEVSNNDWSSSLASVFASVGAFPLTAGSKDAALVQSIKGPYSVWELATGPGNVLVEAYDTNPNANGTRLVNLSARNRVGTGADVLIAGFAIQGSATKRLLIRAIGPRLGEYGVSGTLADPKLEIYGGDTKVAENDNWDGALAVTFASVGAFALTPGSKDAALVVDLRAGTPATTYTALVKGADGGTGVALIEIYELP